MKELLPQGRSEGYGACDGEAAVQAGAMTARATGGLKCSPRRGCVANTARSDRTRGPPDPGSFRLATAQPDPERRPLLLWIEMEYTPSASGHPGQRWGKVKGRRGYSAPPPHVSPRDTGRLICSNTFEMRRSVCSQLLTINGARPPLPLTALKYRPPLPTAIMRRPWGKSSRFCCPLFWAASPKNGPEASLQSTRNRGIITVGGTPYVP